ncbi:hypothetical protein NQZ68_023700 [Dissostichus eleginoides]|nr:hypothetical protein NQZ68_023700 [Dissostichus eleginoides]
MAGILDITIISRLIYLKNILKQHHSCSLAANCSHLPAVIKTRRTGTFAKNKVTHGGVSAVLVIWQTFILLSRQNRHIENWTGLQTLRDVDMELYTGLQRLEAKCSISNHQISIFLITTSSLLLPRLGMKAPPMETFTFWDE